MDNNFFNPAVSSASTRQAASNVRSRLTTPITCYMLPTSATSQDFLNLALVCALACTNVDADISEWKNLLMTYTNCMLSNLVGKLPKDSYKAKILSAAEVTGMRAKISAYQDSTDQARDANTTNGIGPGVMNQLTLSWNIPVPDETCGGGWTAYCKNEHALYAHYALVVFLAGKQITSDNRSAITTNRPRALIEKYSIETRDILTGSTRISDHGHAMFNQAWLEMSSLRSVCFIEFSSYFGAGTDLGQDIILTNVALMRFIQMQHAAMIHKFLLAYPWAADMDGLRQSVAIYAQNLEAAKSVTPALRPFIKVIWGDKSGAFPRKELGPLIACAVATERETQDTLEKYYSDDRFASIVEAFRTEQDRRQHKQKLTIFTPPTEGNASAQDNDSEPEEGENGDIDIPEAPPA